LDSNNLKFIFFERGQKFKNKKDYQARTLLRSTAIACNEQGLLLWRH
jgi:hypothetical protein